MPAEFPKAPLVRHQPVDILGGRSVSGPRKLKNAGFPTVYELEKIVGNIPENH